MSKFIDITNKKFGNLFVLRKTEHKNNYGDTYWLCKCECGKEIEVLGGNLRSLKQISCGCFNKKRAKEQLTTHGLSKTKIYKTWKRIKYRCYNKNNEHFDCYGGRGIKVCDEWLNNPKLFYDWAINNGYKDGLTIDRINVNGDYEPSNCRWVNQKEQCRNKRNNLKITIKDKTLCLAEWSEILNLTKGTVSEGFKKHGICYIEDKLKGRGLL